MCILKFGISFVNCPFSKDTLLVVQHLNRFFFLKIICPIEFHLSLNTKLIAIKIMWYEMSISCAIFSSNLMKIHKRCTA